MSLSFINSEKGLYGGPPVKVDMGVSARPLTWETFDYGCVVLSEWKNNSDRGLVG